MSAAAEFVTERMGTIRLVVWGGFASFAAALVGAVIVGLALAGPYEGAPDTLGFLAFEAAALVGTAVFVVVAAVTES